MKPYHATLALVLVLLLGWAAVGHADGRGGGPGHGGSPGFHRGGGGQGFHGAPGGFRGHHGGFHRGHHGFRGGVFIGVPLFLGAPGYFYTPPPAYVQPGSGGYWYYCPSAQAYYPNVPSCSESWVLVPAS
jgi:hypothetical protein